MAFNPNDLTAAQKAVAQRIIDIGVELGASQRDIGIALATAKRESDLTNDKTPDQYGSVGIFQGRADDASGSRGQKWGYGTIADITAGAGDQSIRTFYLGANTNGSGSGYNAGLLANKDRDNQSWPLAAWKTQGYASDGTKFSETAGNSPFYAKDSDNGQFAVAALAGTINGINSASTQSLPPAGGALYDRGTVGQVIHPGNPPGTPPPTTTPTPTPSATPTATTHPTAPYTAAASAYGSLPGPKVLQRIEAAPGKAAIALGQAAKAYYTDPLGNSVRAVDSLAHDVGHVASGAAGGIGHAASSVGHAVAGLFGGGGGGSSSGQQSTNMYQQAAQREDERRAAQVAATGAFDFLPQISHGDFHAGETPMFNGPSPTSTSAALQAAGVPSNNLRDALVVEAQKWTGIDYVWGGKDQATAGGLDCSGLVMSLMRAIGVDMGNPDDMNAAALGEAGGRISISDLQPGDMVAWDEGNSFNKNGAGADHIAFYIGNGLIVEAPRTGVKSRIRKLGEDFDKKNRMWGIDMSAKLGKGTVPPEHIPHDEVRPQAVLPEQLVKDVGHLLKSAATTTLHAVEKIPVVGGAVKDVANAVDSAGHQVAGDVGSFVHASENALQNAAGAVGHTVGHGAEALGSAIAGSTIGHGAEALGSNIAHGAEAVGSTIGHVAAGEAQALGNVAGNVAHGVGDVAGAVGHDVGSVLGNVGNAAGNVTHGVENAAGNVAGAVGNVAGKIGGAVGGLFGGHPDAPPVVVAAPGVPQTPQQAAAAQADVGLQNHAAAVAAAQAPVVVPHPVTGAPVVVTPAAGYQGTTNARQAEQVPVAVTPPVTNVRQVEQQAAVQQAQQKAAAAQADRGLANRAQVIATTPVASAPAANVSGGQQGQNMYQAAAQRESAAQADVGLANKAAAAQQAAAKVVGYTYNGGTAGFDAARAAAATGPVNINGVTFANGAAYQQYMAHANAAYTPPPSIIHIAPIADSSDTYYASHAASGASLRTANAAPATGVTPIKIGSTGMVSAASTPRYAQTPQQVMQSNQAAQAQPYGSNSAGYGVSTASTQAMSTGLDRYADARDYYYSPAGGGGATAASVATQMMHPNIRSDAYNMYQTQLAQKNATAAAISALGKEKGFVPSGGGGASF